MLKRKNLRLKASVGSVLVLYPGSEVISARFSGSTGPAQHQKRADRAAEKNQNLGKTEQTEQTYGEARAIPYTCDLSTPFMKLTTLVNGVERQLDLKNPGETGGTLAFSLDGLDGQADLREIGSGVYSILLGARSFEVKIEYGVGGYSVVVGGRRYEIAVRDPRKLSRGGAGQAEAGPLKLTAPMPGKIVRLMVEEGQTVASGQGLIVVEAMKMQNEIKSPKAGVVKAVHVQQGGSVSAGQALLVVE